MELIRAATLIGLQPTAAQLGLDPMPLLRRAGLSPTMIADPDRMIPARSAIHLLEECARAAQCPTFALRMSQHRTIADLGLVSLLIAHQPNLREAIAVMQRYRNRINSTLLIQLEETGGVAVLRDRHVGEGGEVSETERIIGVSRYITNPDHTSCEFSLVVADDFNGRGLGSRLM